MTEPTLEELEERALYLARIKPEHSHPFCRWLASETLCEKCVWCGLPRTHWSKRRWEDDANEILARLDLGPVDVGPFCKKACENSYYEWSELKHHDHCRPGNRDRH
jgi:hypothetical protein